MKKKYKILLILLIFIVLIAGGVFVYFTFFRTEPTVEPPVKETVVTNTIEEYGYNLEDRDTLLFEQLFEELKNLLNVPEYDTEEYVKLISELFIVDLFTIDNKLSRYDVGGTEYVYFGAVDSFKSVVESSIYKTVENNLDGTRTQDLPVVASVTVSEISEITYTMPDESVVDGYRVALDWTYEESLGYDDSGVLIVIPDGEKMGVVFYKAGS